jgi:hypothetical protein
MPHERFAGPTGSASRERFDVFGLDRVVEIFQKLLLLPERPWLERDLPVDWIAHAAGGPFASGPDAPGVLASILGWRRLVVRAQGTLGIRQVVMIADRVGPVAGHVRLPVGKTQPRPFTFGRCNKRCFPPSTHTLGGRNGRKREKQQEISHNHLRYFEDGTG